MLCLTRKEDEVIRMRLPDGRVIDVQVQFIRRGRCRLGIDAPEDVKILRKEVEEQDAHCV